MEKNRLNDILDRFRNTFNNEFLLKKLKEDRFKKVKKLNNFNFKSKVKLILIKDKQKTSKPKLNSINIKNVIRKKTSNYISTKKIYNISFKKFKKNLSKKEKNIKELKYKAKNIILKEKEKFLYKNKFDSKYESQTIRIKPTIKNLFIKKEKVRIKNNIDLYKLELKNTKSKIITIFKNYKII